MKLTIERAVLLKSLNHVQSVVERRNTIPILSNVLIEAGDNLRLIATDLDLEIVETAQADIADKGSLTAPAHMLYDIVRKLPEGGQLELGQGPDRGLLMIDAGRSQFALQSLPADDFPDLAAGDMSHKFTLPAVDLKQLIEKTRFAISTEETRYYLNGIYLHEFSGDGTARLRAVATDGHRLAQVELPLPDGAAGMPGMIVPRKTVGELHKLLEDWSDDVEIALSDAKIRFTIGPVVLTSKLIDGTFPDYERVIPLQNDKPLDVSTRLFAQAVDRVSTISSEKGRAVKLNIEPDRITLSVNNPDSGNAREEVTAKFQDDPIEIGFNAKYLLDITSQLAGEETRFMLADASSPTILRDQGDDTALYVLMPMRV
jgi:DNA polymerase-3 subunit beta